MKQLVVPVRHKLDDYGTYLLGGLIVSFQQLSTTLLHRSLYPALRSLDHCIISSIFFFPGH